MGGSALWWSTVLEAAIEAGSAYDLWISLGKAGGADVRIGWEIVLADAATPTVPLALVDFLEDLPGHDHDVTGGR